MRKLLKRWLWRVLFQEEAAALDMCSELVRACCAVEEAERPMMYYDLSEIGTLTAAWNYAMRGPMARMVEMRDKLGAALWKTVQK